MKAIVHIVKNNAPAIKRVSYLANKKTLIGDWIGRDILFNTESLMLLHHGKGRQTRHVIISLERGSLMESEKLADVAEKFIEKYAPGVAWLGAIDANTKTQHVHLVICNSDSEKTLNFSPKVLQKMQDVNLWSSGLLESGKQGAILSKLTIAKKIGEMSNEQIREQIENGNIQIGRRNRKGEITSIFAGGKRVRLATVQRVILGDSDNRDFGVSQMDLVHGLGTSSQLRKAQTRRRNCADYSQGAMVTASTHKNHGKTASRAEKERESRELRPTDLGVFPKTDGERRVSRMETLPNMGGRNF